MENCIFCRILSGEIPSNKVYEDEHIYAFRDNQPQAPVHVLIVPRVHMPDVLALDGETAARLLTAAKAVARAEGIDKTGFRLVTNCGRHGAQSVGHLHLHVLGGTQLGGKMA
jgi:histidine triad (HIT) family protein